MPVVGALYANLLLAPLSFSQLDLTRAAAKAEPKANASFERQGPREVRVVIEGRERDYRVVLERGEVAGALTFLPCRYPNAVFVVDASGTYVGFWVWRT